MADDMVGVLRELSSLLRRLTEQNDANARRAEEMRLSGRKQMEDGRARLEEARARSEEARANMERLRQERPDFSQRMTQMRDEDLKFKQRLLEEIQRHNQLLETLIVKMGRQ